MKLSGTSLAVKISRPEQFGTYVCTESQKSVTVQYKVLRLAGENSDDVMLISFQLLNVTLNRGREGGEGKKPLIPPFHFALPPLASAKPSSLVLPGQTVTLLCDAQRPNSGQTPEVHWLNPQGEKVKQGSYEVRAASQHDGQWTCVVTLGGKSHTAQISLTLVGGSHLGSGGFLKRIC